MATETSPDLAEELPSTSVSDTGANHRIARVVAVVAGLLGAAAGDRHSGAAGQPDHRPTELAAERHLRKRRGTADRLCGHRAEHHRAVPGRRRTGRAAERRQDGAVVDGAQAGPEGRRPRAAHPARQRRPGAGRAQRPGGHRPVEPGAQPGLPAPDLHRARRPGHRRIRRADPGAQRRASRLAAARREKRLRLPAADRRRVHRPRRADAAGPELLGDRRHPLQQQPHAAEDGRDDPRGGADRRRADRAARPRHRRRHPAPPLPARRAGGRSAVWTRWSSPCWCGGTSSAPTPPTTATS